MGDHAETLEVDYDPEILSYTDLLAQFWAGHEWQYPSPSRQYASILFHRSEEERRLALETVAAKERETGRRPPTAIEPFEVFHPAEDYHQKYYLRQTFALFREISAVYPDPTDLMNSTAAARINGFVGGYGTVAEMEALAERLGLSEEGLDRLRNLLTARGRSLIL